jgi:hypothetical protein
MTMRSVAPAKGMAPSCNAQFNADDGAEDDGWVEAVRHDGASWSGTQPRGGAQQKAAALVTGNAKTILGPAPSQVR